MTTYRNGEGYPDPCAGAAIAAIERERRRERRLARIQALEDYEHLCRKFRSMAEAKGFSFPGQIWLANDNTGEIFKNG